MAVTQTELKSSFLRNILEEEEYQSNVKALQDWLTGATQAATQQYQATAQTAAEQASYDISGAYANYLKQQRAVTAQGQLESGHKEELGDVLQQQYQGAYSQARTAQAQTVAKAQEQYGEDISYASQLYEKDKQSLLDAAIKEADLRANIFKAAEQYAGLTDYAQNITALGADIRDASGNVIGTGKGIYDIDATTDEHILTKYGTNVFRQALLQDEGFKNYLEEEGFAEELEYYLGNAPSVHEKLFGFTETKYDAESDVSRDATFGTKGYIEQFDKPVLSDYVNVAKLNPGPASKSPEIILDMTNPIEQYAGQIGLSEKDVKQALNGNSISDYLSNIADKASSERNRTKFIKNELDKMYNILIDASHKKYIKE